MFHKGGLMSLNVSWVSFMDLMATDQETHHSAHVTGVQSVLTGYGMYT